MDIKILKAKLSELEKRSNHSFYTEYDSCKVQRILDTFLESRNLTKTYSGKRKGWVIECPASETHGHRHRWNDCTLTTYTKTNGFIYISARCRHTSCGDALTAYINDLNKEWGQYLNERYSN
jgi:hypothetical protein